LFLADSELPPSLLGSVAKGGPAWNAGLRPGDRVVEADGREVRYFWQVQAAVEDNPGRPIEVTVERDGTRQTHTVTPASVDDPMLRDLGFSSASGRIEVTLESSRPVALVEPGGAADRALADFLSLVRQVRVFDEPVAPRVIAVLAVNGREPTGWEDVAKAMEVARVRPVKLRVAPTSDVPDDIGPIAEVTLGPVPDDERIGLSDGAPVVVRVEPGSPADRAGVRPGDRIAAVEGKPFAGWLFMIQDLEKAPDAERTFAVVRAGGERADLRLSLRNPDWTPGAAVPKYAFGAANRRAVVDPDLVPNEDRLAYALVKTIDQTERVFVVTVAAIGGLFTGRVSVREMGGPIMIYQIASTTGKRGWGDFFNAMAWLSMSIGILNLLPVPVLDGGNLVMFGIEAVRRRPVGRRGWQVARFFGVAFLMLLMVLVFTNDFGRLGAMMDMK
ncbi:MAG: site-2 protease family protein, partial [Deltaproteobacteria bacterium]|nr:site-2 protease family protein [Deltaproteobacteria bacterium]